MLTKQESSILNSASGTDLDYFGEHYLNQYRLPGETDHFFRARLWTIENSPTCILPTCTLPRRGGSRYCSEDHAAKGLPLCFYSGCRDTAVFGRWCMRHYAGRVCMDPHCGKARAPEGGDLCERHKAQARKNATNPDGVSPPEAVLPGEVEVPGTFTLRDSKGGSSGPWKKYNDGKPALSLLPANALEAVAAVSMFGAEIYGQDNWKGAPSAKPYIDAGLRHFHDAGSDGKGKDKDSGLPHLAHAAWNALSALAMALGVDSGKLTKVEILVALERAEKIKAARNVPPCANWEIVSFTGKVLADGYSTEEEAKAELRKASLQACHVRCRTPNPADVFTVVDTAGADLRYDPDSGWFFWGRSSGRIAEFTSKEAAEDAAKKTLNPTAYKVLFAGRKV